MIRKGLSANRASLRSSKETDHPALNSNSNTAGPCLKVVYIIYCVVTQMGVKYGARSVVCLVVIV
ncbi:hypothetical protein MSG28_002798 [Choristoneura fumiferana]|uniref:Uncharacterized protein n=1 Tax=Choristoneura fumiferana TaxID=7141 RepID=A0ACC0JK61_CHOFU|nr:hypothetical protein MSG28_002798 [Choristoneura fumiferana]